MPHDPAEPAPVDTPGRAGGPDGPVRVDAAALAALPAPEVDLPGFLLGVAAHGDVVAYPFGTAREERVLLADPAAVHRELARTGPDGDAARDTAIFATARAAMGDGLITTREGHWRPRRLLIQRELSHRTVRRHAESFARAAAALVDGWADDAVVDVADELGGLALRNLGEALFTRSFDDLRATIVASLAVMQDAIEAANFGTLDADLLAAQAAAAARLDAVLAPLVAQRLVAPASGRDLLAVLAAAAATGGPAFPRSWVRDEAMLLVVGGHETVAFATAAAVALLAAHPAVADELVAQVDAARRRGVPPAALADEVALLRHVVEEALRLHPPVPVLHRIATEDLVVAGRRVPRGTLLVLSPLVLQRDPRWWPDPLRFDPWRFAEGRRRSLPRQAYLPFGVGQRICVGNHFALLEAATTLGVLAAEVRLEPQVPVPPRVIDQGGALRFAGGLPVRVRRRRAEAA